MGLIGLSTKTFSLAMKKGLRNLISACEEAMRSGEARSDSIGEFLGVRVVDPKAVEQPFGSDDSVLTKVVFGGLALAFFACLFIGLFTVISWFV